MEMNSSLNHIIKPARCRIGSCMLEKESVRFPKNEIAKHSASCWRSDPLYDSHSSMHSSKEYAVTLSQMFFSILIGDGETFILFVGW